MAITRPFTALAFAAPVGILVIPITARRKLWRSFAYAFATGVAALGILVVWNHQTTGHWTRSPLAEYRRQYLPFDKPGFGLDSTAPTTSLSQGNAEVYNEFAQEHVGYTPARIPAALFARLKALGVAEWNGWRLTLLPLVMIGVATAGAELWFAIACGASLVALYLLYAHFPAWTIYYFEAVPVAAFCATNGIAWIARRLRQVAQPVSRRAIGVVSACVLLALSAFTVTQWRRTHIADASYDAAFASAVSKAPFRGMVVFVHYVPDLHPHSTLVTNSATLRSDRVWVAIDDSLQNHAVMSAAGGRTPLLFNEKTGNLSLYRELLP